MLALQREHTAVQRAYDAGEGLARRIAAVDAAIDWEVYPLYGLTKEEIKIVEHEYQSASSPGLCYNRVGGDEDERSHRNRPTHS